MMITNYLIFLKKKEQSIISKQSDKIYIKQIINKAETLEIFHDPFYSLLIPQKDHEIEGRIKIYISPILMIVNCLPKKIGFKVIFDDYKIDKKCGDSISLSQESMS